MSSERSKIWVSEPETLTIEEFERLVEEEEEEERAEAVQLFGHPGHRLTITIPLPVGPMERIERFEDPLEEVLGSRGIVHGVRAGRRPRTEDRRHVFPGRRRDVDARQGGPARLCHPWPPGVGNLWP